MNDFLMAVQGSSLSVQPSEVLASLTADVCAPLLFNVESTLNLSYQVDSIKPTICAYTSLFTMV